MKIFYRKPFIISIFCILLLVGSACSSLQSSQNQNQQLIELTDCQLRTAGLNVQIPAKCGQFQVFENRPANSGKLISLNVAVIPAVSRNPAADPVFYLAGGPGEAATQSFLFVYAAMNKINQMRDIVLVDQRGTGGSNPLNCDSNNSDDLEKDIKPYIDSCIQGMEGDPHFYTTSIAMDDLDEVRQALGYDQINLYGASYGTRAAMVYARQHPDHVRTMILDGVVPLDWTLGPTTSKDAQKALEIVFKSCKEDENCQAHFPAVEKEFDAVLKQLQERPIDLMLKHPTSGETIEYKLTLESFVNTIHLMSYSPETIALLPLLINQAHAKSDFTPIAAQAIRTTELLNDQLSVGMRFSVICSEDQPFFDQYPPTDGYIGDLYTKVFNEVCALWPVDPAPEDFKQTLVSDIPTLLISGEFDPVTPPSNGEHAALTLSESMHLIAPHQSHINLFRGCFPNLALEFMTNGSTQTLDPSCIKQLKLTPFFINPNGPIP